MIGSLEADEIESVLVGEVLGRVGFVAYGRPQIAPVAYVYDSQLSYVYVHSTEGFKVRAMRANPDVCFEVEQIRDMGNWRTVVARARFEELPPDREQLAMDRLTARLAPVPLDATGQFERKCATQSKQRPKRNILYRLHLLEKSGRFERT
jgi:nitroimidazol reductase NimA-like FMN-containing flavoprotein (pyridoxamine 5'-phosphate oxidase superfamily)